MNQRSGAMNSTATAVSAGFLRSRSCVSAVMRCAILAARAVSRSPLILIWMKGISVPPTFARADRGGAVSMVDKIDYMRPPTPRAVRGAHVGHARFMRGQQGEAPPVHDESVTRGKHHVAAIAFDRHPDRAADAGDRAAARIAQSQCFTRLDLVF